MSEGNVLRAFLAPRTGTRFVFAPFIQANALEQLLEGRAPTVIVTRWEAQDLLSGSSDLRAYELAKNRGWTFQIHPRLHLKVYCWNLSTAHVGSANVTARALGWNAEPNEELMLGPVMLTVERQLQLARIRCEAILVDEATYQATRQWLENNRRPAPELEAIPRPIQDKYFLTSSLPMSESPHDLVQIIDTADTAYWMQWSEEERACAVHDMAQLGLRGKPDLPAVRKAFFAAPFVQAIDQQLQPCLHFGQMKEWIQRKCTDVPVPKRRDLTTTIQRVFQWFRDLDPKVYTVDVPGTKSERLCAHR